MEDIELEKLLNKKGLMLLLLCFFLVNSHVDELKLMENLETKIQNQSFEYE